MTSKPGSEPGPRRALLGNLALAVTLAFASASGPLAVSSAIAAEGRVAVAPTNIGSIFDGTWWKDGTTLRYAADAPFLPASKARFDALKPQDDPGARCIPGGLGRLMISPQGFQAVALHNQILVLNEGGNARRIWTDIKAHDPDWDPGFMGESIIAKWDGDTMVVDTINFKDNMTMDSWGYPMSASTHLVERWKLLGPEKLQIEYTWTDPKNYTKPIVATFTYSKHQEYRQGEYFCTANNRNNPDDPNTPRDFTSTDAPAAYQERPGKPGS